MSDWPALRAAAAHDATARLPFSVNGTLVGSVARMHLSALRAWPHGLLHIDDTQVALRVEAGELSSVLAQLNAALRQQGLIRAWRDEVFALFDPASGATQAGERGG